MIIYILTWLQLMIVSHDFHVSNLRVNYDQEDQSIEMVLHLFLDDLELALEPRTEESLHFMTDLESERADSFAVLYLKENLQIKVNNKISDWQYLGKEKGEDFMAGYFYLEIPLEQAVDSIEIESTIFFDIFDDQMNVLQFMLNGKNPKLYLAEASESTHLWSP